MIKIHWTHLAIILALVIGIFLGSQMNWAPSIALAADTNSSSNSYIAMTVYNNTVFIAKGNTLYALKMVDHPYFKGRKIFEASGKSEIDKAFDADTTFNPFVRPIR